jgi:hypothetical protein
VVFAVTAPSTIPSDVVAIADTTVFTWLLAVLNAMRVPPSPLKESVPVFAVEISVQVMPASVERRMPRPKYESLELFASPVAARIRLFAGLMFPG